MILTWKAQNDPHRLTKGFESIENWSGTSRETEGFFPSGQEPLITTHASYQVKTTNEPYFWLNWTFETIYSTISGIFYNLKYLMSMLDSSCLDACWWDGHVWKPQHLHQHLPGPASQLLNRASHLLGLPPSLQHLPSHQLPTTTR